LEREGAGIAIFAVIGVLPLMSKTHPRALLLCRPIS
jgi:hypothetical protein